MRANILVRIATSCVLCLLVAAPALADLNRIPGTMGQLENDYEIPNVDRGGVRMGAVAHELGIVYPLMRSNTANTNGLKSLDLHAYKHFAGVFDCYAESNDRNGSALKIVKRTVSATGHQVLSWGTSLNAGNSKGTYGVVCYPNGNGEVMNDEIMAVDYDEPSASTGERSRGGSSCMVSNDLNLSAGRGTGDFLATGPFTAVCSLIRDNTTNTNGLSDLEVRLLKSGSESQTCTAYVHDKFGNLLKAVPRTATGTGAKTLDWEAKVDTSSDSAYYSVRCDLNANTTLGSIYWKEPSPSEPSGDRKIMPANECKTVGYLPLVREANRLTATNGFLGVPQTNVQCAPMRDTFSDSVQLSSLQVRGHGIVLCEGIVGDGTGNYILKADKENSTASNFTFDWAPPDLTANQTGLLGARFGLECWLPNNPASAALYSIAWKE